MGQSFIEARQVGGARIRLIRCNRVWRPIENYDSAKCPHEGQQKVRSDTSDIGEAVHDKRRCRQHSRAFSVDLILGEL